VILLLQRLRQDEDGQALVLGAVFGLVLMLCVLSTVNLGRAVHAKIQLQTAADAAAYSQAAVEARVLNFTAYTNRAMVVHYASIMAAAAYLTWVHFLWAAIDPALSILRNVPYAGPVFATLQEVFRGLLVLLDTAVAVMTPLVSAANVVLYTLQEGAWLAVGGPGGRLSRLPPEAHSGDSAGAPYEEVWPALVHAANQAVFARTRGSPLLFKDVADSGKILLNDKDDAVQMARAHMIDIANSAREPWVAYGDRWSDPSTSPLARHAAWQVGCPIVRGHIGFQIVSRTEMGSPPPPASASEARTTSQSQIYSGQRLQLGVKCGPIDRRYSVFQLATMDQVFASLRPGRWSDFEVGEKKGGLLGRILSHVLRDVLSGMSRAAARTRPDPDRRLFWLSPYVSFAPQARSRPGGATGQPGNFAQPDVVVGLVRRARDYDRDRGASKYFGRRFGIDMRAAGNGSADFRLARDDGRGAGPSVLPDGLTAFAAAQVYYHRPGDWREVPNLFNPLWGARLMPIAESNAANLVPGLLDNPVVRQFLLH
jgi:Putative Flp pilus-assembly TadE/G-like